MADDTLIDKTTPAATSPLEGTSGDRAADGLFQLSPEYVAFQASCRAFVSNRVLPKVEEAESAGSFPKDLWPELAQHGFLGLGFPEEFGGSGVPGMLSMAIFSEEIAKSSGGIAITPLVSSYMAAPHLLHFGTTEQQQNYLPPTINGEKIAAIAITEPGAGSDVAGIDCRAKATDDGYVLNGTKMFITNGGLADYVIVAAKTDPTARHSGITMLLVEKDDPGFSAGRSLRKMGWHSSDTRELVFTDCFVPADRVVGEVGRGFFQIVSAFQSERISLAAMGVGLAQACYDDALEYAKNRVAFGQTIGNFQAVRHSLAEMQTMIEAARVLTYRAAAIHDDGLDSAEAVAMAKLYTARVANDVADGSVQIFGGYGFLEETRVVMHYRDARVLRIGGGTDETQMEILAKRSGLR